MDLYQKLETDMKTALREGNSSKLSVLRMLISAIKMFEIDNNVKKPEEPDILQIIQRQAKQRRESIEQFKKGNRNDLAEKEAAELNILESYLPKQLAEEDLEVIIKAIITDIGASTKSDTGRVMKAVMDKVKGKCDGKAVSQIVMRLLQ